MDEVSGLWSPYTARHVADTQIHPRRLLLWRLRMQMPGKVGRHTWYTVYVGSGHRPIAVSLCSSCLLLLLCLLSSIGSRFAGQVVCTFAGADVMMAAGLGKVKSGSRPKYDTKVKTTMTGPRQPTPRAPPSALCALKPKGEWGRQQLLASQPKGSFNLGSSDKVKFSKEEIAASLYTGTSAGSGKRKRSNDAPKVNDESVPAAEPPQKRARVTAQTSDAASKRKGSSKKIRATETATEGAKTPQASEAPPLTLGTASITTPSRSTPAVVRPPVMATDIAFDPLAPGGYLWHLVMGFRTLI